MQGGAEPAPFPAPDQPRAPRPRDGAPAYALPHSATYVPVAARQAWPIPLNRDSEPDNLGA